MYVMIENVLILATTYQLTKLLIKSVKHVRHVFATHVQSPRVICQKHRRVIAYLSIQSVPHAHYVELFIAITAIITIQNIQDCVQFTLL
jgi:hypothetical protein